MDKKYAELLLNDRLYDCSSLSYENGELTRVADPRDSKNIPEGRMGEFALSRRRIAMGMMLYLPLTDAGEELDRTDAVIDSEVFFQAACSQRLVRLEKLTADEAALRCSALDSTEDLVFCEYTPGLREWAGFIESDDGTVMLGTICLLPAGESAYLLTYAGIGSFTDIRMEQSIIEMYIQRGIRR